MIFYSPCWFRITNGSKVLWWDCGTATRWTEPEIPDILVAPLESYRFRWEQPLPESSTHCHIVTCDGANTRLPPTENYEVAKSPTKSKHANYSRWFSRQVDNDANSNLHNPHWNQRSTCNSLTHQRASNTLEISESGIPHLSIDNKHRWRRTVFRLSLVPTKES